MGNASYFYNSFVPSISPERFVFTTHECYRPIIGLFTTMNINYSYVILPKMGDGFDGMAYHNETITSADDNPYDNDNIDVAP